MPRTPHRVGLLVCIATLLSAAGARAALPAGPFSDRAVTGLPGLRLAAPAPAAGADSEPDVATLITACDRLAAGPFDTQSPERVRAVPLEDLAPAAGAAAEACREEVARNPNVARFRFQLGRALQAQGSLAEARRLYTEAAELGSSAAMHYLAYLYDTGGGGARDSAEARRWYAKAVEGGHTPAIHNLAYLYSFGRGGPKDTSRAAELLLQAMADGIRWTFEQFRTNADEFDIEVRRGIQTFLIEEGFLDGGADGVFGPKTKAALDAYEKAVIKTP